VKLVTIITEVAIVCTVTLVSTIYLRKFGDCGRKRIHNNHTNLVTTVRKGTTGASANNVGKANILTTLRVLNLIANSNQNEEKHGNRRLEELRKQL
jgi:hypothetical protein